MHLLKRIVAIHVRHALVCQHRLLLNDRRPIVERARRAAELLPEHREPIGNWPRFGCRRATTRTSASKRWPRESGWSALCTTTWGSLITRQVASSVPQTRSVPDCYPCLRKKMGLGLPAEGLLGAARLAPSGSPFGRSTSLRDVVEPCLFVCRGFELSPTSNRVQLALLDLF